MNENWIKCSDRMPNIIKNEFGEPLEFNVTIRDATESTALICNDCGKWLKFADVYYNGDHTEYDVIAWQPMPEPYKEEKNHDKILQTKL